MSDTKISAMTLKSAPIGADYFPIIDSTNTSNKRALISSLANGVYSTWGIGVTSPSTVLHVVGTNGAGQLRLGYDASKYLNIKHTSGNITQLTVPSLGSYELYIGSTNVLSMNGSTLTLNNTVAPTFYVNGPNVGGFITAGNYSTYEFGIYCANGDETIAAFDPDEGVYHYFDRSLYGVPGGINIAGSLGIYSTGGNQITVGYDPSNFINISVNNQGVATFTGTGATTRFIFSFGVSLADGKNLSFGTSTGSKIGTATNEKLAFHNSTPVIQRASASQTAVVTTAATNVAPYGFSTSAQADAIVTLVNELRAAMVEKGLIKGAA